MVTEKINRYTAAAAGLAINLASVRLSPVKHTTTTYRASIVSGGKKRKHCEVKMRLGTFSIFKDKININASETYGYKFVDSIKCYIPIKTTHITLTTRCKAVF